MIDKISLWTYIVNLYVFDDVLQPYMMYCIVMKTYIRWEEIDTFDACRSSTCDRHAALTAVTECLFQHQVLKSAFSNLFPYNA